MENHTPPSHTKSFFRLCMALSWSPPSRGSLSMCPKMCLTILAFPWWVSGINMHNSISWIWKWNPLASFQIDVLQGDTFCDLVESSDVDLVKANLDFQNSASGEWKHAHTCMSKNSNIKLKTSHAYGLSNDLMFFQFLKWFSFNTFQLHKLHLHTVWTFGLFQLGKCDYC